MGRKTNPWKDCLVLLSFPLSDGANGGGTCPALFILSFPLGVAVERGEGRGPRPHSVFIHSHETVSVFSSHCGGQVSNACCCAQPGNMASKFESSGHTGWNNDFVGLLQYGLQKLQLLLAILSVVKCSCTVVFMF